MSAGLAARGVLAAGLALGLGQAASAQVFHLLLACKGVVKTGDFERAVETHFALRDNNHTALIQRSDVLPVGERMHYVASPSHYTMVYQTPLRSSLVYRAWWRHVVVWWPAFEQVLKTRISIDRHSGELQGEMVDAAGNGLGRLQMDCEPTTEADAPAPRL